MPCLARGWRLTGGGMRAKPAGGRTEARRAAAYRLAGYPRSAEVLKVQARAVGFATRRSGSDAAPAVG